MLRISVTTIEAFRKYQSEELSIEKLLDYITKPFAPNIYMEYGTAIHDIIQNYSIRFNFRKKKFVSCNNIEFDYKLINNIYSQAFSKLNFNYLTFENKETKNYNVYFKSSLETVQIVGKYDILHKTKLIEIKNNFSYLDIDNYINSCQWKFYLEIFGYDLIDYYVFCFTPTNDKSRYELSNFEIIPLERYDTLADDCQQLIQDFYEFIKIKNLENYFIPKLSC